MLTVVCPIGQNGACVPRTVREDTDPGQGNAITHHLDVLDSCALVQQLKQSHAMKTYHAVRLTIGLTGDLVIRIVEQADSRTGLETTFCMPTSSLDVTDLSYKSRHAQNSYLAILIVMLVTGRNGLHAMWHVVWVEKEEAELQIQVLPDVSL